MHDIQAFSIFFTILNLWLNAYLFSQHNLPLTLQVICRSTSCVLPLARSNKLHPFVQQHVITLLFTPICIATELFIFGYLSYLFKCVLICYIYMSEISAITISLVLMGQMWGEKPQDRQTEFQQLAGACSLHTLHCTGYLVHVSIT